MSDETNSRGSAVFLGSRALGHFAIPATEDDAPAERRLVAPPEWDDEHQVLVWMEDRGDAGTEVIAWPADTPEEQAEAERLYQATHPPRPDLATLIAAPPQPGDWLIAWRCADITMYVCTTDEAILFSPQKSHAEIEAEIDVGEGDGGDKADRDDADEDVESDEPSEVSPSAESTDAEEPGIFVVDPSDAAVMSHQQALALLPRLHAHLELEEDDNVWLEPVSREQALTSYRSESSAN